MWHIFRGPCYMQELFKLSLLLLLLFFLKYWFFFKLQKQCSFIVEIYIKSVELRGKLSFPDMSFIPTALFFCPEWAFASFISPNLTMHQQLLSTPSIKLHILFYFIPIISLHIYISTNCFNIHIFCHPSTKQASPTLALESRWNQGSLGWFGFVQ